MYTSIAELLTKHISENYDIELQDAVFNEDGLTAQYQNGEITISITFVKNEITGECCDIELYSEDIPELDDISISRDDSDNDELYEEIDSLNGVSGDMDDYLRDELDDDEDRGQSL